MNSVEISNRFEKAYGLCKDFIVGQNNNLFIDRRVLFLVVKSAFDDIGRYKAYHLDDPVNGLSNSVKTSAYYTKWICKLKPIQQNPHSSNEGQDINDITVLLANGACSLYLAQIYIGGELNNPFFYKSKYFDEFIYDLLFRQLGDDGLLHIFQNIHSAVKVSRAGILEFSSPY